MNHSAAGAGFPASLTVHRGRSTMTVQLQSPKISIRRFNVSEYYQMVQAGILSEDERVELLEGEVVAMNPIGSKHAACVNRLNGLLSPLIAARQAIVLVQNPIHLSEYSEPQPDVVLVNYRDDFYEERHPGPADIILVIEVSDTSIEYDHTVKLPLYARAGIPAVWLVDLEAKNLTSYLDPSTEGYRQIRVYEPGDAINLYGLPGVQIMIGGVIKK
jgi:Uma2 family endonuclease